MSANRRIDQGSLEAVSAFRPGSCLQAATFGRLWPAGFEVDRDAAALVAILPKVREMGLDITFAACAVAHPDELLEFRAFLLGQLDGWLPKAAPETLEKAAVNSAEHKAATWRMRGEGAPATGELCYSLAVAARKAARSLAGKEAERSVRDAQHSFWERKIRRLAAGEVSPILGEA